MAHKSDLANYLEAFEPVRTGLNTGLRATELEPVEPLQGAFRYGLEVLYADALSTYDAPPLQTPETHISGLEASPVIGLDTGSNLTVKALQIFLNVSGYKGADGKTLTEDGSWGKNSLFALDAWKKANAGKAGISQISVDQRKGMVWLPSNIAGEMRSKLSLIPRGQRELARTPVAAPAAQKTDSRNAIPSVQEASAGPGNVFENAQNVRGILRALDVQVPNTGAVDTELVQGWRRAAKASQLNDAVSAQAGAAMMEVNANTLSVLRTKSRRATSTGTPSTKTSAGTTTAATTTRSSASSAGTVPVQTSEVQNVLRALGWTKSVTADGKFGPKTRAAWESSSVSRKLDKTITGAAGATRVNVNSTTLARLQQDASMGSSKGSSTSIEPVAKPAAKAGLTKVLVGTMQDVLIALKVSPGKRDGLWGPNTQKAWASAAKARNLDATANRAGPKEGWVAPATLAALSAAAQAPAPAKTAPAGKSAETAPKAGLSKVQVGTVQDLLIRLKANPGKRDGLWGPNTKKAWVSAAKNRNLDSTISRASPTEAWVSPVTLEKLSLAATGKAVKPTAAQPPPSANNKDLVAVKTDAVSVVMRGFGKKAKTTAELLAAWKSIAKSEKLDERSSIDKGVLYAVKNTADALAREASLRLSIADLVRASDKSVPVATLQDAISFWSNYDASKKKYGAPYAPKSRGTWDAGTLTWALRYLNIAPGVATTVWERGLPMLVAKDKKSLKLASKYVAQINTDAANFKKLGKVIATKNVVEKKHANEEKQLQGLLDSRVKASTVVISIKAIQQALSELNAKIAEGRIRLPAGVPLPPQARVSGAWDGATRIGFLIAYGEDLLGKLPVQLVDDLFIRLLFKPSGVAGLYGLYGLGAVLAGAGATHMRVPPVVAKYVADDASAWVLRTKPRTDESASTPVVFNPAAGGTTQLDPAFITGRVEQSAAPAPSVFAPTPQPEIEPEFLPPQPLPQVEQPSSAGPAPVTESASAGGASESAGGTGGSSQRGASESAGGAGGSGGGSTVNITTAAPPPASSLPGGPWPWIAGGVLALGLGLTLSKNGQQVSSGRAPMRAGK